jgi:molybdopterin-guanine dinucleotide biosynthesis protein A
VTYDGVVLTGGEGRRLGGVLKPAITVGGRQLLDIALDALAGASNIVGVGAPLPTSRAVTWIREEPAGGGPVAGLAAALPLLQSPYVVVLAADLPFITAAAVDQLAATSSGTVATLAVDDEGRDQPLIGCYDTAALRVAMPDDPRNASMRSVLHALSATGHVKRLTLGGEPPVAWDCDTAEDLTRAQELA